MGKIIKYIIPALARTCFCLSCVSFKDSKLEFALQQSGSNRAAD